MRSTAARTAFATSLLVAAALAAGSAAADDAGSVTARLAWQRAAGTESCLDGESLKRAVNRRWGRSVFTDAGRADILLTGAVSRSATNQWVVSVELRREDGTNLGSRQLVTAAPYCSSLDDSVALAVGLMLDVSRQRIVEERANGVSPAGIDGPRISIPKETLAPRAPWRVAPSVGVESALGLLPGLRLAPRIALAVVPPHFVRTEVAVAIFPGGEELAREGRVARLTAWTAELVICPLSLRAGPVRTDGCVAERLGQVRGTGVGFSETETANKPLSELGIRELTTLDLTRHVALFLGLGVEVPFVRYRFVFGDSSGATRAAYEMPPAAAFCALGLEFEW